MKLVFFVISAAVVYFGGYFGYPYITTPPHMRSPEFEHYHFRTQIIVEGEAVDFSEDQFQQEYDATSCSAELNGQPIDFHDSEDQMTHIHWSGVTGGELLKYYGWNLIGGDDNSLGTRFDQGMMQMHRISTIGNFLPEIPADSNFYIYTGDESDYEQKDWQDFLYLDLEEFFGKQSLLKSNEVSFDPTNWLIGKVFAHSGVDSSDPKPLVGEVDKERLARINNLIGNAVIFVQQDEPTNEEIVSRFNQLVPLHDSTCGG
ncbi:hypothetical protein KC644_01525 [Candidatus Berkelbacteria bacterium]|nr:hypothetical protein [Candidatus Berkelbacteria bacterium]